MLKPWFIDPNGRDRREWFNRASKHCEFATRPDWMPHLTLRDVTWQDGAPPFIGWWLTKSSVALWDAPDWRWWDGQHWSFAKSAHLDVLPAVNPNYQLDAGNVRWCLYWPERARVPRLPPGWIFTVGGKLPKEAAQHHFVDAVAWGSGVISFSAQWHELRYRAVSAWRPAQ